MNLSEAAKHTLMNTVGRTGAKVRGTVPDLAALHAEGLVSREGNLTRKGVGIRAELITAGTNW